MRSMIQYVLTLILLGALLVGCSSGEPVPTVIVQLIATESPTSTPQPTDEPVLPTPTDESLPPTPTDEPAAPTPTNEPLPPTPTELAPEPAGDEGSLNLVAAESGGSVVSVTEELACCPASKLLDGYRLDGGEWWTGEPPTFPQVIVFDLAGDEAKTIDRVVLNPWTSEWRYAWVKDFELYVSDTDPDLEDMGWVGSFRLDHYGIDQAFEFEPVDARYVALVVTSHWGGDEGITLNEFEVYEASPDAVAVEPFRPRGTGNLVAADHGGSIVDYSSEDSSGTWTTDHLIDGEKDTETGWSSSEELDELQYVVFSFPNEDAYVVNQVVLNPYSEGYTEDWIQEFELWGSDTTPDLDEMIHLGSFWLAQVGEDQAFTFDPVLLRYVTLVPRSNYGGTEYALNEFEVYEVGSIVAANGGVEHKKVAVPEDVELGDNPLERPPTTPPDTTFVPTEFSHPVASSGESPLDNIGYEINHSDLVPAIYHLYGPYFDDLVVAAVTNHNPDPVKLRIEASVANYTDVAVDTITLEPGETVEVRQNPPLLPDALDALHGMKNATLHLQLDYLKEGEKRLIYEGTEPITVYSRDDFPWGIPGYYSGAMFLATMVTPNDPALDELLRVAADYAPGGQMVWGYSDAEDSDSRAWNTMKAIYDAVSDHYDVTYVATGLPFVPRDEQEEGFWLQRLKLPYEVLDSHSGMCAELSLLFASAFEKMYLRPILIRVPGHMYVGVPISEESKSYYFLESTMVGQKTFEEAVQYANQSFMEDAAPYIEQDRQDVYYWLDVWEAREEGIWPLPWR